MASSRPDMNLPPPSRLWRVNPSLHPVARQRYCAQNAHAASTAGSHRFEATRASQPTWGETGPLFFADRISAVSVLHRPATAAQPSTPKDRGLACGDSGRQGDSTVPRGRVAAIGTVQSAQPHTSGFGESFPCFIALRAPLNSDAPWPPARRRSHGVRLHGSTPFRPPQACQSASGR